MRHTRVVRAGAWFAAGIVATVAITGTAVAATGGTFILGRSNSATTQTNLTNSAGTALSLTSKAGTAPLKVSNSVRVTNLNADRVDGLSSEQLQRRVTGTCPAGQAVSAVNSNGTVTCAAIPALYSAVVGANGTVVRSTGGTITGLSQGGGEYIVRFPQSVRGCTYTVTTGLTGFEATQPASYATVVGSAIYEDGVFVVTFNSSGSQADAPFHIIVAC